MESAFCVHVPGPLQAKRVPEFVRTWTKLSVVNEIVEEHLLSGVASKHGFGRADIVIDGVCRTVAVLLICTLKAFFQFCFGIRMMAITITKIMMEMFGFIRKVTLIKMETNF